MKLEAYLGPKMPETIATGETVGVGSAGIPRYGVVKQHRDTGDVVWVGAYTHYGTAMARLNSVTTHLYFGMLTNIREAGVAEKVAATNASLTYHELPETANASNNR